MRITSFAAIYIGTYDVTLEIFEISKQNGIRSIDKIRKHLELGTDTYSMHKISMANVHVLCDILEEYMRIIKGYRVEAVRAIAASAIRDAENNLFITGRIQRLTGLSVESLSNSEQRFLSYKAIAGADIDFPSLAKKGTVVIDIGGGSLQITVFRHGTLQTTLNLRLGSLRVRDRLMPMQGVTSHYEKLVEEYMSHELYTFRRRYLEEQQFGSVILNGDFITETLFRDIEARQSHAVTRKKFDNWYEQIVKSSDEALAEELGIAAEFAPLLRPTAVLYHKFVEEIGAERIYATGATIPLGIARNYAEEAGLIKAHHDFDEDILSAVQHLARRYDVEAAHAENVAMIALAIFDGIKKKQGLKSRDRLLLHIAVMLHEVGKYISLNNSGESAYHIIMNNEIIGLSHREREAVALIVKHNTFWFPRYEVFARQYSVEQKRYQRIAQIVAILRLANELDRSHMQKIVAVKTEYKEQKLTLRLDVNKPLTMEQSIVHHQIGFFEEVFNLEVNLRVRRVQTEA